MSRLKTKRRRQTWRGAFTLLEIILALAILAGSLATMGEVVRLAVRNAESARRLTQAELLAVSKLAEITAGVILPDPVEEVPFDREPDWTYSISTDPTEVGSLVALRIVVVEQQVTGRPPIEFTLVQWILDPDIEFAGASGSESTTTASDGDE
jgi:general secretion pathway protein I